VTADASSEVRFLTRPMRASDESFTYATFLHWIREADTTEGIFDKNLFPIMKAQWAAVLRDFDVLVAHPEGDEEEIGGYLAHKAGVIGFVYVKRDPWRRLGVANLLLKTAGFRKSLPVAALFASSRALALAESRGWKVTALPGAALAVKSMLGLP